MVKKKKYNVYEDMTYTPKIIESFKPSNWGKGEWSYDKDSDTHSFDGQDNRELIGYKLVMMGVLDGKEFTIAQPLGGVTFDTIEEAKEYFERYYKEKIVAGLFFSAKNAGYPSGVINEFSL